MGLSDGGTGDVVVAVVEKEEEKEKRRRKITFVTSKPSVEPTGTYCIA